MVTDTIHTVYSIVSEAELGFLPILETEKGQLAPSMAMYNFLADKFGKQANSNTTGNAKKKQLLSIHTST